MNELTSFVFKNLLRAWERNAGATRALLGLGSLAIIAGFSFAGFVDAQQLPKEIGYIGFSVGGIGALVLAVIAAREQLSVSEQVEQKIRQVEEKALANPE